MRRLALGAALLASGCRLYSLQDACGPGFDGGACVIPGGAGASTAAGGSSGGVATTASGGSGATGVASGGSGTTGRSSTGAAGSSTAGQGSSTGGAGTTGAASSSSGAGSTAGTSSSGGIACASGWTPGVVAQSSLAGGLTLREPEALALYGGLLYVADVQTGALFSIDLTTGAAAEINGSATPQPVSLAPVDGGMLVGNSGVGVSLVTLPALQQSQLIVPIDTNDVFDLGGLASAAGTAYFVDIGASQGCFFSFDYLSGATQATATPLGGNCGNTFLNGPLATAQFNPTNNPQGLALDPTGTVLYLVDEGNGLIRSIDLDGGQVTTLAGALHATADADGPGNQAAFVYPVALAVDGAGDIFVAETTGAGAVRKITVSPTVDVQTLYDGNCAFTGVGTDAPAGIAVDAAGKHVYVSDKNSVAIWSLTGP
ncbi:MAG: hypothetical protein ACYDCL_16255 [Myxococcales bacterium]